MQMRLLFDYFSRSHKQCLQLAAQALDEAEAADIPSINLCTAAEWAAPQKSHGRSCTRNVRLFGDGGCEDGATLRGGHRTVKNFIRHLSSDRPGREILYLIFCDTCTTQRRMCSSSNSIVVSAPNIVLESIFVAMLSLIFRQLSKLALLWRHHCSHMQSKQGVSANPGRNF